MSTKPKPKPAAKAPARPRPRTATKATATAAAGGAKAAAKAVAKRRAAARPAAKAAARPATTAVARPAATAVARPAAKPRVATPRAAARPPSPLALRRTFARDMAELLRADARVARVRVRAAEFALELDLHAGDTTMMFLENYFQESSHLEPGARMTRVLARMTSVLRPVEGTATWGTVVERLLPVLRSQSFFRAGAGDLGSMPTPAAQPFLPYIDLGLVVDEDDRMSYVSSAHLLEWGVTLPDALLHALRNSARLAPPVSDDGGRTFHIDAGDDHESSRLAIPGFLAAFDGVVDGHPVAIIPSRSQLWITGDEDPARLAELAELARQEYRASNRAISPAIYTADATGEVVPFQVPPSHPAYHAVRLGHVELAVHEYGVQQADLDEHHAHDGVDLFVAGLNGLVRDDGLAVTWALWGDGIDTLLPAADLICLEPRARTGRRRRGDVEGCFVPFGRAQTILGDALVPAPGYRPARYHVCAHPTGAVLDELRAAAVTIESFEPVVVDRRRAAAQ